LKIQDLRQAAAVLRRGGVVAYPTESCYGLGCDPNRHEAVRRLLHLKGRPWQKGLILISDHVQRLYPYIGTPPGEITQRVLPTWPGPVTWLIPARPSVSRWLRGSHPQLAVRVTAHPGAAALCRHAGMPLVSTSANRSGRPPARSAGAVRREFGNRIDYVLEGTVGALARPTEIRNGVTGEIVRPG
jgi:L-threonylcarbamoyladenylate synthase